MIAYCITNPAFPGWVKIGFTSKTEMKTRLSVYQTGTPFRDYCVEHVVEFVNARLAEKEVHNRLKGMNCECNGEWFKCSTKIACNILDGVKSEIESNILNKTCDFTQSA